jgi:hypothetical protein
MAGLNVEQFKKALSNTFVRWSGKVTDAAELIGKINKRIALLDKQIECATPEGEKKFKAEVVKLKQAREKVVKAIESAGVSLRIELMFIEPPQKTKANESEFRKLPGFIGDLVEKKGVPLGKTGVVLKPDVDFNFKEGKLEKFGIELEFEW